MYGSGGFCSYSDERLREQLGGFVTDGHPAREDEARTRAGARPDRLDVARAAIGDAELFVDANGAFSAKQALRWAERYVEDWDVRWFEEPVSSADFDGAPARSRARSGARRRRRRVRLRARATSGT